MENNSALQTGIHNLSDEELLKMIKEAASYRSEAISYAQEELSRRGGINAIEAKKQQEEEKRRQEEEERRKEYGNQPLYLHIPISRLIIMSILSFGLYEVYWMYKNWRYLKERSNQTIHPFWMGIFGIFFCHSLLHKIHSDQEGRLFQNPLFSPNGLATGWVILVIISKLLFYTSNISANIIAAFIPTFLCILPVQNYINAMTKTRNPSQGFYGWSLGHISCLVVGIIVWAFLLDQAFIPITVQPTRSVFEK